MKCDPPLSIAQASAWAKQTLQSGESPDIDVQVLLCFVLDCQPAYLLTWPERLLSEAQLALFKQLIDRRQRGEPVAHLTGQRAFWTLDLKVSADTLIPRPETELLVEEALALPVVGDAAVLDLGTGTGAIALALAAERPNWKVTAVDFKDEIVDLARQNALNHNITNVTFQTSNWFEQLKGQRFSLIVSNPPYVESDSEFLQRGDVRFEPLSALTAGVDGLDDIRAIVEQSHKHLLPGGWLVFEHGFNQAAQIQSLLALSGFSAITSQQDLAGLDRITFAQLCG